MSQRETKSYPLVATASLTGQSLMLLEKDFRNAVIEVITVGFTGTLNFYHSKGISDLVTVDLSSAASAANPYAPVMSVNLDTGAVVSGTTGYTYTTITAVEYFEINSNLNFLLGAKFTRSAGTIAINVIFSDNQ